MDQRFKKHQTRFKQCKMSELLNLNYHQLSHQDDLLCRIWVHRPTIVGIVHSCCYILLLWRIHLIEVHGRLHQIIVFVERSSCDWQSITIGQGGWQYGAPISGLQCSKLVTILIERELQEPGLFFLNNCLGFANFLPYPLAVIIFEVVPELSLNVSFLRFLPYLFSDRPIYLQHNRYHKIHLYQHYGYPEGNEEEMNQRVLPVWHETGIHPHCDAPIVHDHLLEEGDNCCAVVIEVKQVV